MFGDELQCLYSWQNLASQISVYSAQSASGMRLQPCHLAQFKKIGSDWASRVSGLSCPSTDLSDNDPKAACPMRIRMQRCKPSQEHLAQAPSKLTLQCTSEAQEVIQVFIGKDPIRVCVPHGWAPLCNLRPHHLQPHRIVGIVLLRWPFL